VSGVVAVRLELGASQRAAVDWTVDAARLDRDGLAWLDLPASQRRPLAARLLIRGQTRGQLWLRATGDPRALEGPLRVGGRQLDLDLGLSFDTSGFAVLRNGDDLRVWVNHHAQHRAFLVRRVVPGDLATLVEADPPVDTAAAVVLRPEVAAGLPPLPDREMGPEERLEVVAGSPSRLAVETTLTDPAVLVTTIPASPLWRARIDGEPGTLLEGNGLFLALPLAAGSHRVELEAAIPALWYVGSGAGLAGLLAAAVLSRRRPTA
jgi:hypothetical protein